MNLAAIPTRAWVQLLIGLAALEFIINTIRSGRD